MEETLPSPKMADIDLLNNLEKISSLIPNRAVSYTHLRAHETRHDSMVNN